MKPIYKMRPDVEAHLAYIKEKFLVLVDAKYRKGQKEHGGRIWTKSSRFLLDNAIDESIDQVVYLLSERSKLDKRGKNANRS